MKKHKSSKSDNTNVSNSKAELFVLPPELLAQLGINLSNIQHSEVESPATNQLEDSNQSIELSKSKSLPESKDTSTIIETANLMKESVFLSPTFLQTASNVMADEEEPVINDSVDGNNIVPPKSTDVPYSRTTETEDILMCEEISPQLLHDSIIINSDHEIALNQMENLEVFESVKEYEVENQDGNLILTDVPYQNTADNKISNEESFHTVEEHPDEAYLPDCSNDYLRCSSKRISLEGNKQKLFKKKEITEEVPRGPSDLKDTQLNNAVLTPVTVNSIAKTQMVHTNLNTFIIPGKESEIISTNQFVIEQPASVLISGNSNTTEDIVKNIPDNIIPWTPSDQREKKMKITKIDDYNKSIIHIDDYTSAETQFKDTATILVDSKCVENTEKKYSEKSLVENVEFASIVQENIKYIQSSDKHTFKNNGNNQNNNLSAENYSYKEDIEEIKISETKNGSPDRVKEIAAYLSQIVNERKNINRNINSNTEIKNCPIKFKSCNQGVEKPDGKLIQKGNIECAKVLKTYQRTSIRKQTPELYIMPDKMMTTDKFQLPNNPNILYTPDINVALRSSNEFCVCYDFGNLAYYDCEMLYEHIHFWPHDSIHCDSYILYSIYNEDNIAAKQSVDFIEDDHQTEHGDNERGSLCWNELIIEKKNETLESISDPKISREAGLPSDHKSLDAVCKFSLCTSEKAKVKTDRDVKKKAKINRKKSSNSKDQGTESEAKMKSKCGGINSTTTSEASTSTKSTRNTTNSETDLPSTLPVPEYFSESNDPPVTDITVISTRNLSNKDIDLSSNPTIRTSTVELIDFNSKPTKISTISNIETAPSKSNQESIVFEKNSRSIKTAAVTSKLTQFSLNNISKSSAKSNKTNKLQSSKITESPKNKSILSPGVTKNTDMKPLKLTTTVKAHHKTPNHAIKPHMKKYPADSSTKCTENSELVAKPKEGALRKKLTESVDSVEVAQVVDMNTSPRSTDVNEIAPTFKSVKSSNTKMNNETSRTTKTFSGIKSDSSSILTKSTQGNELAKFSKIKESVTQPAENSDSIKKSQDFEINFPTKSVRKLSEIENTSTKNTNSSEIDAETPRKSSKVKNSPSDSKGIVAQTRRSRESTDLPEVDKAINMNISPLSRKFSDLKTEATPISLMSSNLPASVPKDIKNEILHKTNDFPKSSRSSKECTIIDNFDIIKSPPKCNENSSKMESKTVTSSRPLKQSTNIEICESPKSTKRYSNTVTIHTPVKKAKPAETNGYSSARNKFSQISSSKVEKSANPPAVVEITGNDISNIEETTPTRESSREVINRYVPKNQSTNKVNNTTEKSTKIEFLSENEQCESTDCKITYCNKKNTKTNSPKDTEIVFSTKSTEPLFQNTDTAVVNSTISEESLIDTENYTSEIEVKVSIQSDNSIQCGVCEKSVEDSKWIKHIFEEHDYCAWRASEPALDLGDEVAVRKHLQVIGNQNDGLKCSKCGLVRKFAKAYMRHVKYCTGKEKDKANISTASVDMNSTQEEQEHDDAPLSTMKSCKSRAQRKSAVIPPPPVTCGVCSKTIEDSAWIEHIRVEHKYLAWRVGEKPVNLDDEEEVKSHLKYISKYHGGLLCNKCGAKWNYVKKYLVHDSICGSLLNRPAHNNRIEKVKIELSPVVTCGICKLDVEGINWIKHNQLAHEYLAWIEGEKPIDVDDPDDVKEHLTKVVNMAGELVCMKCGTSRIYAHAYLLHVNACTNSGFEMQITDPGTVDKDKFECGVCHEQGNINKWKEHAMKKHYNVAWMVGELPINLRNFYAVEKYLKEYQKKHSLVCNHCRATRTSGYGFYAHILTCGKTDEEIEAVHNICEICNSKYLCVYRNQHLASHRDQEQRREMRDLKAQRAAEKALKPQLQDDQPLGKRKAAEKAKKVIEKYTLNGKPVCSCGQTFRNPEQIAQHNCAQKTKNEDDESDVSVKMEAESGAESESGDTDSDSLSGCEEEEEDEEEQKKKKRQRIGEGSTKITRMSYRVNNYNAYLAQSYKDFSNFHLTSESLFNEWRNSEYVVVPHDEMSTYLPTLTESCKVRFGGSDNAEWVTYKRFEARKVKGYSIFTGGVVQCISWAPPNIDDETLSNYLAVSTHVGADVPRHGPDERPEHPAMVQIWDFKQFNFMPTCSLGLALDYGIVWGMDWCPSGARDRVPREAAALTRLGLLAVACSNGTCYILAVPCPPVNAEEEFVMYKLKPVAELRLTMTSERRVYQATSIKWSQQKGHDAIIVGYSDGTTALYDLNTESPFLKTTDNDVTVFYPFQDKQSESSSVTGVGLYPSLNTSLPTGGWFSASATGGSLCAWPRAAPSARCHAAAAAAAAAAHWPAVMLSGDAPFMKSVTEMEWWGGGRRLGASRAACACARCGRAAAAAAPALRLLRCHPCYPDLKKQIIATLLMIPIGQKRKRKVNDDLSMVVEPLTYGEAVDKYGLQLTMVSKRDQAAAQQLCNDNEFCPQRFPLSDIVAVAFCPSARFHDRLALATHSGMLFVINA